MTLAASFLLFKLILMAGLALWLAIVSLNNVAAFRGGAASVGGMMSMQAFNEPPAIESPLLEQVLDKAERIAAREAAMGKALREGRPISKVLGADYETMLKKQA